MTSTTVSARMASPTVTAELSRSALPLRRRLVDLLAKTLMVVALAVTIVPLGLVIFEVFQRGASIMSIEFLTEKIPNSPRRSGGGMAAAIVGTLIITGAAALIAIPLGVLGAIYLNEYGRDKPLARLIRTMSDVMTGVPSVVMGLFVYVTWVLVVKEKTGFAGALALACLMLPVVIRSSEEMLRLVPAELRQASAALGARKWKTIVSVVLPAGLSGLTSGAMLAIARAAGETAPLILVAGVTTTVNWSLFDGQQTALPAQIFKNATEPFAGAQERAWGAALTLMVIVLIFTVIARLIASHFAIKKP